MSAVKLLVLGSSQCGKSAITLQYCSGIFLDKYVPTIEDSYRQIVKLEESRACMTEILDLSGTEFVSLRDIYISNADGFVIVFDITSRASFDHLDAIRDLVVHIKEPSPAPIVLVGTKCDMESKREVSSEEGQQVAKSWNCTFLETSAKDNYNISQVFQTITERVITQLPKHCKKGRKGLKKSGSKEAKYCELEKNNKCTII